MSNIQYIQLVLGAAVVAIIFGIFTTNQILSLPKGNKKMQEIASAILDEKKKDKEEADRIAREQEAQQHHDDDAPKPTDADAAIKEALERAARERDEAARQDAAK